jgi:toxin ParE1/3/4
VADRRLDWSKAARADLLAILDYISDDNPDAAERLIAEIEAKASRLPERPHLYRKGRATGTREMVVRPNYLVVYAVDEQAVRVLRVLHAAQNWPT